MPLRKTAIAVPAELLEAIDRAARARNESRNRFIVKVLQEAVRARRDSDITRRLNELFADEALATADLREARELARAASDWSDEGW